jgi:hypothetical protein
MAVDYSFDVGRGCSRAGGTMSKARILRVIVAAASIALALAPSAVRAARTSAFCDVSSGVTLDPGITTTPSQGTFASRNGSINCDGRIRGKRVKGKGPLTFSGHYGTDNGDTCDRGAGRGKLRASLPKRGGGHLRARGRFTFTRYGSTVFIRGSLSNRRGRYARFEGTLNFQPTHGDCVTTRVTRAHVSGSASIHK